MIRSNQIPRQTVYICVEIKNRELDSQVLLAAELALRGFRCIIGSHASIFAVLNAKKGKGGILLDKGTLPSSKMKWIRTKCESIVVMDQELGPPLENPIEHLEGWPSRIYPETDELIDKYLCVGPKVYEAALKRFAGKPEKVILTGWPRVDIWRTLGYEIYRKEIASLRKKYGEFLLFVSDFGLNEDENIYIEGLKCVSPNDQNFQKTLRAIRSWDKNKDVSKIVIRPHIIEDVRLWKKIIGQVSKTEVQKEMNVTPWVLASSGIIHRGSTVAFEAKLAGKDVFFLKETSTRVTNGFVDLVSDAIVSSDLVGPFPTVKQSNEPLPVGINEYVFLDEISATTRVIRELASLTPKIELGPNLFGLLFSQIRLRNLMRFGGLIKHEISWKFKKTDQPPYSHCFPGGIRRKDFERVLKSSKSYLPVKVRPLTFNCLVLSK